MFNNCNQYIHILLSKVKFSWTTFLVHYLKSDGTSDMEKAAKFGGKRANTEVKIIWLEEV